MKAQQFIRLTLKLKLILLVLSFFVQDADAQYFIKSYDLPPVMTKTEIGKSIQREFSLADDWSIAGFSNSTPNAGSYDWMFLRLDKSGLVKCSSLLGFGFEDSAYTHVQLSTPAKDYVLGGFYSDPVSGKHKASFTMLDTTCGMVISKRISDTLSHTYRKVVRDSANSFTFAGYSEDPVFPGAVKPNKMLVSSYTAGGSLMWAFDYLTGLPSIEEAYSVCYQAADGTYGVTGRTNFFTGSPAVYDVYITKLSPGGIPIWTKAYPFPVPGTSSNVRKIISMPDGGFVIVGWTDIADPGFSDVWVLRVGPMGFPLWSAIYGAPGVLEQGHSIIEESGGTLVFTGFVTTPVGDATILVNIPPMPPVAPIWASIFGGTPGAKDKGYDLQEAFTPSGYGVTGQTFAASSSSLDPYLMRTDIIGLTTPGCNGSFTIPFTPAPVELDTMVLHPFPVTDETIVPTITHPSPTVRSICVLTGIQHNQNEVPDKFNVKQNYPNPFNPSTNIEFSIPQNGFVSLKVYDIAGKEVGNLINEVKTKGNYIVSFSAKDLPSGIYFYKLSHNGISEVKKMTLVK